MAEDLISEYIDRDGIKRDTDYMIDQINKVEQAFNKLNSISVSLQGVKGSKDLANTSKQAAEAQNTLSLSGKQLLTMQKQQADIELRLAKTRETNAKATKEEARASEAAAKAQAQEARAAESTTKAKQLEQKISEQLTKEKDRIAKASQAEMKQQEKLTNAYEQLKQKYLIAANTAKRLGAEHGLLSKEFQEASTQAQKYWKELDAIENAVGQSQRRVGQYERAQFSLNQVLREAPAFANSLTTGFMALSNNIPMLVDEINNLKKANLDLVAAGEKPVPILKTLSGALFSWNTVILLGITLLTAFGDEIFEFAKGLFTAKKSIQDITLDLKKFTDAADAAKAEIRKLREEIEHAQELSDINLQIKATGQNELKNMADQLGEARALMIDHMTLTSKLKDKEETLQKTRRDSYDYLLKSLSSEDLNKLELFGITDEAINMLSEDGKKIATAYKKVQDDLTEIQLEGTRSQNEELLQARRIELIKAEIAAQTAEDQRKILLESTRTEAEIIQSKNRDILNNERSTLEQRLNAITRIAAAQKRAAEAEKNAVLSDPTASDADKTIAIKQAAAQEIAINIDTERQKIELKEQYRLRDLEAQKDVFVQQQQLEADNQKTLLNSVELSLTARLQAQQGHAQAQKAIIDAEYKYRLQQAGLTEQQIIDLQNGLSVDKVQNIKITNDELFALQKDHESQVLKLGVETQKGLTDVLKAEIDKQQGILNDSVSEIRRIYSRLDMGASQAYAEEVIALNESLKGQLMSRAAYTQKRAAIDQQFRATQLANSVKFFEAELAKYTDALDKEATAKAKVEDLKKQLASATTDEQKKAIIDQLSVANKELDVAQANADKRIQIEQSLADKRRELSDALTQNLIANEQKLADIQKQLAEEVADLIRTIVDSGYEYRIRRLDDEIAATEAKREKDIEVANQAIANVQLREQTIAEIEARAAAKKHQLEQQKKQTEIERAKLNKAADIAMVLADSAQTVFKLMAQAAAAKAQAALLMSNPVTAPYAPVALAAAGTIAAQIPFVIGLGVAQAAKIAATPLPKYFKGKGEGDNYEGWAHVGDGGRSELIVREDGTLEVTPDRDTLTYVGKNDIIYPDAREVFGKAPMAEVNRAIENGQYIHLIQQGSTVDTQKIVDGVNKGLGRVERAIKNKQEYHIHPPSTAKLWISSGLSYTEFIGRFPKI